MLATKTLNLFNVVPDMGVELGNTTVSFEYGVILPPEVQYANDEISAYLAQHKLSSKDLNKTFHKSWSKILESTREDLLVDQIRHYITGYGTNFEAELYIPNEILNIPDRLKFTVIKTMPKKDIVDKCLLMLESGVALNQDTIEDILYVLEELGYTFSSLDKVRNKEASIIISDRYAVYPSDPSEFFRFVVYKSTGETLLIKNRTTISAIKCSLFNPRMMFESFGLEKLSEVFNRYKCLFLAYKDKCGPTINKISKLSKKHHKPMVLNPLNVATSRLLTDRDLHWVDNATIFSLFKVLNALSIRNDVELDFVYKIRNGKSFAKTTKVNISVCQKNLLFILSVLSNKVNNNGKKVYIPDNVCYALPTSEKDFIGNIPAGTKIFGDNLAAGVYWENKGGATDIDISGINIDGKVGWNASYNSKGHLAYSGDITDAPNGAVEYLWANKTNDIPTTLVMSNVYSGSHECEYKIIVGAGDDICREYMMNPDNVIAQAACKSVQKNTILGVISSNDDKMSFTFLNRGAGQARVSSSNKNSDLYTSALLNSINNSLSLEYVLKIMGYSLVDNVEECDIDLSLDKIDKSVMMELFV